MLNKFTSQYIDEALALPPSELEKKTKSDEGYTFLHALAGYTRDRQVLRDQLVAVLLAGRDTTAVTLSWLFYEISKQPKIVEKLRTEIEQHCADQKPTYDNLKSMRYLSHTINETLRLYPVWSISRFSDASANKTILRLFRTMCAWRCKTRLYLTEVDPMATSRSVVSSFKAQGSDRESH